MSDMPSQAASSAMNTRCGSDHFPCEWSATVIGVLFRHAATRSILSLVRRMTIPVVGRSVSMGETDYVDLSTCLMVSIFGLITACCVVRRIASFFI